MNNIKKICYSALAVLITAYASSYFTQYGIHNWYESLSKPIFIPADSVFPIVWSILYILLTISFFFILIHALPHELKEANNLFLSQLLLQIIWCFLFFYSGYIGLAFVCIILLDFIVYKMIRYFHKICHGSAYLLYPYFAWLCYASFLNLTFIYDQGLIVVF